MTLPAHLAFPNFLGTSLHLGVCGSIAAYKSLDLLRMWQQCGVAVGCTLTASAQEFVRPLSFSALGAAPVHGGMFPVGEDIFAHLEPGRQHSALVIAPATANILAKLAHGLADDMLSCQALAHPGPLVIAPAMNPNLWHAPATQSNVAVLRERGHVLVGPVSGDVACGDTGKGRLAQLEAIFLHGLRALSPQDLSGLRVLLTLGPTREFRDPVRFWSNPSTGIMGASLAVAAWLRGARVTAVCGPGCPWLPEGIERIDVVSALEMQAVCETHWSAQDVGCFTAAVADYRPATYSTEKLKKTGTGAQLDIAFALNPDILAGIGQRKTPKQRLLGFAAETSELEQHATEKMIRKGLDIVVGNRIDVPEAGFGSSTNIVMVFDRWGRKESWPQLPKPEIAWRLWDWLLQASS